MRSAVLLGPVAQIDARAALILATVLEQRHLKDGLSLRQILARMGVDAVSQDVALHAVAVLRETGERALPTRGSAEANGNGDVVPCLEMIDSAKAASLLGVTTRRVCQLAHELDGARTTRGWMFSRAAVVDYAKSRGIE